MAASVSALMLLSLFIAPAVGEMSEYERGVANGLKIGMFMGELYGKAQYATDAARQFNSFLDEFDGFLKDSFGTNQSLINSFKLSPIQVSAPQTGSMPEPDASGRIYGYPADAYYAAVGAVPGTVPENAHASLPGI